MKPIIKLKIDVTKFDKSHFFKGKNGAVYADVTLLPNRKYGNDYMCVQDIGKEAREKGERGAIIGNAKEWERKGGQQPARQQQPQNETDDVAF